MDNNHLIYQLALTLIPDIGAVTAKKLISYVGSPEGVFKENASNLKKIPGIGTYLATQVTANNYLEKAEKEVLEMKNSKIRCLYYLDAEYPWRLKECEDGPLLLFYRGTPEFNRTKYLSIVGTRNASPYGREYTRKIIETLSAKYPDLVIVSGLAYGIDITAHRAALEFNLDTFAILAHGLNTVYPSLHRDSALKILNQGGLISDFHSYIKPERNNFLRRNRIIAGLSDATLVIESGERGGALITADIALSYNREVLAIPGRANDSMSVGCNQLIKKNIAALVESADDIEQLLGWEDAKTRNEARILSNTPLSESERNILQNLNDHPDLGLEILSVRTDIPVYKLSALLLQMELSNWISVLPGNLYRALVKPE